MAYLGLNLESPDVPAMEPGEAQQLDQAFQEFSRGDFVGAASTLGTTGAVKAGLISTGVGEAIAGAIAIGFMLLKLVGRGRTEADLIVPIQNQLINSQGTGQLDQVTQIFLRNPNVTGLRALYEQVERSAQAFIDFVSEDSFTDGRASAQALNTVMPYVNGTCGYSWPPPMRATQNDCVSWGDGTPGGVGTNGILGALARAIQRQGGTVPPPLLTQGYGTAYPRLAPSGSQNYPWISQAGGLPNVSPLSPIRPTMVPVVSAGMDLLLPALIGGAAFWLFQKRKS